MDFKTTEYKRCDLVKTSGRVDGSNAPQLEEIFKSLTEAGKFKLVYDMSEVSFMSSAGWWVLIRTQKTCRRYKRGEVVMVGVDQKIRGALDLVGMGSYFKIFDDITAAVGSF